MKLVFVTGVSKGIGKALVDVYLNRGWKVIGIGRNSVVNHPNYSFMSCDLLDNLAVSQFQFPNLNEEISEIILINNAGILGEINRISHQDSDQAAEVMQVNYISPVQLIRKFAQTYASIPSRIVANISSGAGKRPISGWANYCASKAAIDLFSLTFSEEEKELGNPTHVFSISPGVIDTEMQVKIREASSENFSKSDHFKNLKKEGKLQNPPDVAELIFNKLLLKSTNDVICSLT
jgi:benzil reductase ((S)-benzoin forming)